MASRQETLCEQERHVIVTGRTGKGKSTALNNVFGLDLPTRKASPSTACGVLTEEVEKHGIKFTITDTSGYGSPEKDVSSVAGELEFAKTTNYTLVYCHSVAPSSTVDNADTYFLRILHDTLGRDVWERCVILFTSSDYARLEYENSADYKAYIRRIAQKFNGILSAFDSDMPSVKSVYDFIDINELLNCEVNRRDILAIPVRRSEKVQERNPTLQSVDILPDLFGSDEKWTDLVFTEIMRKAKLVAVKNFSHLRYGIMLAGGTLTLLGGVVVLLSTLFPSTS